MSRTKKGTPPSYPTRPHRSGQARITVRLTNGRRRDITLGHYGSQESRAEYRRVLVELEAHGGHYPVKDDGTPAAGLTLNELSLLFWKHAEQHYRLIDGSPSRELNHYRLALEPVLDLYGPTLASEFGPLAFKAVRQRLIDRLCYFVRFNVGDDEKVMWLPDCRVRLEPPLVERKRQWHPAEIVRARKALARKVINQRMDHIKRLFAWAVSEELVAPAIHEALLRVAGLRRGHAGTRDTPRVKPVPDRDVQATLPFLLPQVAAMVRLQQLMSARPTEVCLMQGRNVIDRDTLVWKYVIDPNEVAPGQEPAGRVANLHKTAHQEEADGSAVVKVLPIGPRAQEILKKWLRLNEDEFLFQPVEARAAKYAERRKERKTPLWDAHISHQARKRKATPGRSPRDHYDRHGYAHAVARAAKLAGVPHWHPHQLKHVCGTDVRRKFGVEAARAYMGHTKLSTAEIYAERDMEQVEKIALEMG